MQDLSYEDAHPSGSPGGMSQWLAVAGRWAAAALSLFLVVAIIVWAYRLGVRDARDIPVIRAQDGPIRVQPADAGGTEVAHQGLEVNEILAGGEATAPGSAELAPAPAPLTDDDQPVPSAEESTTAALSESPGAANTRTAPPLGGSTAPRPRPEGLRVAAPTAVDTEPTDGTAPPPGTRLVQLGAFDSEEQARGQWRRLRGAHTDLLGTKERYIQRAESNGRVFYRLRVVGFETSNDQRAICEALRARSVDCIPVTVR